MIVNYISGGLHLLFIIYNNIKKKTLFLFTFHKKRKQRFREIKKYAKVHLEVESRLRKLDSAVYY